MKFVNLRHLVLARAICALETNPDRIIQEMGSAGKVLDEGGFGGTAMMQAVAFAFAGIENKQLV